MLTPLLIGFATGLTLIVAIGAQNAFILRQGIRREHVLPVVAICTVSDMALMAAASQARRTGHRHPQMVTLARFGGAAFLIVYGCSPPGGHGARAASRHPKRGRHGWQE